MSPQILIDPADLRTSAKTYRDAGVALSEVEARLRVPPPSMPADLRDQAIAKVAGITRDVTEQRQYIDDEARELVRRAALVEKADDGGFSAALSLGLLDIFGLGGVAALAGRFLPSGLFGDREDRRIANDERMRTPPGGRNDSRLDRGRGINLNNDWAGREILERYLRGGDDWTITDDPDWTRYMKANPELTQQLDQLVQRQALVAFDRRGIAPPDEPFDHTTSMEIQNGEGITGYEYLHGTNGDVGGFRFKGSTQITKVADGYDVKVPASYTWNDVIDPNPQYGTDTWKSRIAEIVTLGRADPYDIHITWSGDATVHLDKDGNVRSVTGYPGG
jgi:hypothetical protein